MIGDGMLHSGESGEKIGAYGNIQNEALVLSIYRVYNTSHGESKVIV